jgi:uncharacterized protein YwqG
MNWWMITLGFGLALVVLLLPVFSKLAYLHDRKRRSLSRPDDLDDAPSTPPAPGTPTHPFAVDRNAWFSQTAQNIADEMVARHVAEHGPSPKRAQVELPSDPTQMQNLVQSFAKEAILLPVSDPPDLSPGLTFFGGVPIVPAGWTWPRGAETDRPLIFLAQIDVTTLPDVDLRRRLPESGVMYFFYSAVDFNWNTQVSDFNDCVLFASGPTDGWSEAVLPEDMPDNASDRGGKTFDKCVVTPRKLAMFPSDTGDVDHDRLVTFDDPKDRDTAKKLNELWRSSAGALTRAELDATLGAGAKHPQHWMGGYPSNIQEAGDEYGPYHVLLLEIGREPSIGFQWGGPAAFQFWIDPKDLAAREFGKAVLTIEGT